MTATVNAKFASKMAFCSCKTAIFLCIVPEKLNPNILENYSNDEQLLSIFYIENELFFPFIENVG